MKLYRADEYLHQHSKVFTNAPEQHWRWGVGWLQTKDLTVKRKLQVFECLLWLDAAESLPTSHSSLAAIFPHATGAAHADLTGADLLQSLTCRLWCPPTKAITTCTHAVHPDYGNTHPTTSCTFGHSCSTCSKEITREREKRREKREKERKWEKSERKIERDKEQKRETERERERKKTIEKERKREERKRDRAKEEKEQKRRRAKERRRRDNKTMRKQEREKQRKPGRELLSRTLGGRLMCTNKCAQPEGHFQRLRAKSGPKSQKESESEFPGLSGCQLPQILKRYRIRVQIARPNAMRAETRTYWIPQNLWQVMEQVIITWNSGNEFPRNFRQVMGRLPCNHYLFHYPSMRVIADFHVICF